MAIAYRAIAAALLMGTALAPFGSVAANDEYTSPQPRGLSQALWGSPRCDHVIRLMIRSAVTRPQHAQAFRHGGLEVPAADLGDLRIDAVTCIPRPDGQTPPTYLVTITNASPRAVLDFEITLVVIIDQFRPTDPSVTAQVEEIAPGKSVGVQLRLPVEALAMPAGLRQRMLFNKLLVAIDSRDCLAEVDESNNVLVVNRADVPPPPSKPAVERRQQPDAPGPETAPHPSRRLLGSAFDCFEKPLFQGR